MWAVVIWGDVPIDPAGSRVYTVRLNGPPGSPTRTSGTETLKENRPGEQNFVAKPKGTMNWQSPDEYPFDGSVYAWEPNSEHGAVVEYYSTNSSGIRRQQSCESDPFDIGGP